MVKKVRGALQSGNARSYTVRPGIVGTISYHLFSEIEATKSNVQNSKTFQVTCRRGITIGWYFRMESKRKRSCWSLFISIWKFIWQKRYYKDERTQKEPVQVLPKVDFSGLGSSWRVTGPIVWALRMSPADSGRGLCDFNWVLFRSQVIRWPRL